MARYGREMVEQLLANPQYQQDSRAAIPARIQRSRRRPVPLFVQADFGLDAELRPAAGRDPGLPYPLRLPAAAGGIAYREAYEIDAALQALPGGMRRGGIPRTAARGHRRASRSRRT